MTSSVWRRSKNIIQVTQYLHHSWFDSYEIKYLLAYTFSGAVTFTFFDELCLPRFCWFTLAFRSFASLLTSTQSACHISIVIAVRTIELIMLLAFTIADVFWDKNKKVCRYGIHWNNTLWNLCVDYKDYRGISILYADIGLRRQYWSKSRQIIFNPYTHSKSQIINKSSPKSFISARNIILAKVISKSPRRFFSTKGLNLGIHVIP